MIRYDAEINGEKSIIEFEEREGRCNAVVDGRHYGFEVARHEDCAYQIFIGDSVYQATVFDSRSGPLSVKLRGHEFEVRLTDRKHLRPGRESHREGLQSLVSPMPGKVVRVLCVVGEEVTSGQGVIVVEAMKMQNEIKAAHSGKLIDVHVAVGDTVESGQILAVIEGKEEGEGELMIDD